MLLALTVTSLLVPQAPDPAPAPAIELLSLQPLRHVRHPLPPPPFGSLLELSDQSASLLARFEDGSHQFDVDQVLELLRGMHPKEAEQDQLHLDLRGDNLVAAGPGPLLQSLRDELAAMIALATRPIEVTASLYDAGDGELPPAIVRGDEQTRVLQGRKLLWTASAHCTSGDTAALEKSRWSNYVRDVDVTIAQKSTLSAPVVSVFFEGVRVAVEVHALTASQDLVLCCQFACGQRRGNPRSLATGLPGQAALDVPVVETSFGGCSGRLSTGGALLVGLGGHAAGGSHLLLVIAARYLT